MKNAIVVDANDVKLILAKHFDVKPEDVIKSQYSYTVVLGNNSEDAMRSSETEAGQ